MALQRIGGECAVCRDRASLSRPVAGVAGTTARICVHCLVWPETPRADLERAAAELERRVESNPGDVDACMALADLHVKLGNYPRAAIWFSRVADQYEAGHLLVKALFVLKRVARFLPDDSQTWERLGRVYERLGMEAEAANARALVETSGRSQAIPAAQQCSFCGKAGSEASPLLVGADASICRACLDEARALLAP